MFITFEGPEGSGKSTIIKRVVNALEKEGMQVVLTREPGGTPIAEQIRNVILNKENTKMDSMTEALLYAASRRQHLVEKIWPSIKEGKIVLCDRFLDSSLAYQGFARDIGVDKILEVNQFAIEGCFPDLTLLFDINPRIGLARIAASQDREINRLDLENIEFHDSVRMAFLELAKRFSDRYVVIDASKTIDEVTKNVLDAIRNKLAKCK